MRVIAIRLDAILVILLAATLSAEAQQSLQYFELSPDDKPFKPYVAKLYTPKGIQILRDAPPDHLHHHALMFAIGVDGVSYWEETSKGGRQVIKENTTANLDLPEDCTNPRRAGAVLEWYPPGNKLPSMTENRTVVAVVCKQFDATILYWSTELSTAKDIVQADLTGSHYNGLGMRFIESMDKGGRFLNSHDAEGEIIRGDERIFRADWCAYQAEADGKPVTVAIFDTPSNTRPATFFTMGDSSSHFAYLAATLGLYKAPMPLKNGETLIQRYGVVAWDGHRNKEEIAVLYNWWTRNITNEKNNAEEIQ